MDKMEFGIGDIVRYKHLESDETVYYIVCNIGLDNKTCVILQIYPINEAIVENNFNFRTASINELKLVIKQGDPAYLPFLNQIEEDTIKKLVELIDVWNKAGNKEKIKEKKEVKTITFKDVIKAIKSKKAEKQIEYLSEKMNRYLEKLHKATVENNEEKIEFYKSELGKIRDILFELEYFPFKQK